MKTYLYAGLLLAALFAQVKPAYAVITHQYGFFCNTCTTASQFTSSAYAQAPMLQGNFQVDMVNYNTNAVYHIVFTRESESGTWYTTLTSATPGTADETNGVAHLKAIYTADAGGFLMTVPSPVPYSLDSFNGAESQQIDTLIASNPLMVGVEHVEFTIAGAFKALFGDFPIVTLVYPNGDVAQYSVINPAGGDTCCVYRTGTARNAKGQPIDPPGQGGNYVRGGSGGDGPPGSQYVQSIVVDTGTYSCSYINNSDGSKSLIGCTSEP